MQSLNNLYLAATAIGLLGQGILLWLQLRAYSRFRHKSFVILAVGTMLGVASLAISVFSIVRTVPDSTAVQLFVIAMALGLAQLPVAVWGVVLLFRSYGELFHRNAAAMSGASAES